MFSTEFTKAWLTGSPAPSIIAMKQCLEFHCGVFERKSANVRIIRAERERESAHVQHVVIAPHVAVAECSGESRQRLGYSSVRWLRPQPDRHEIDDVPGVADYHYH